MLAGVLQPPVLGFLLYAASRSDGLSSIPRASGIKPSLRDERGGECLYSGGETARLRYMFPSGPSGKLPTPFSRSLPYGRKQKVR
jgi:hypothetical protein